MPQGSISEKLGYRTTYEEYVKEYGEENAQFIMETLGDWTKNYKKMSYINMSVGIVSFGKAENHRSVTKEKAKELGWAYEEIKGDMRLIEKLINGNWNEDEFLVIPPGSRITSTGNDEIVSTI